MTKERRECNVCGKKYLPKRYNSKYCIKCKVIGNNMASSERWRKEKLERDAKKLRDVTDHIEARKEYINSCWYHNKKDFIGFETSSERDQALKEYFDKGGKVTVLEAKGIDPKKLLKARPDTNKYGASGRMGFEYCDEIGLVPE